MEASWWEKERERETSETLKTPLEDAVTLIDFVLQGKCVEVAMVGNMSSERNRQTHTHT